jgi:lipopolysaccharide biosynthesis protein
MNDLAPSVSVAVLVHVHYREIWHDISALLAERLTVPFHLVVTSSLQSRQIVPPRCAALLSYHFLPVENRGRDILPFLQALAETEAFDFGLKLHTKKSPQREDGTLWRGELLDSLLPAGGGAAAIVAHLQQDRRVGLVTPDGFTLSVRPWILQNDIGMERIKGACDGSFPATVSDSDLFAAGSMFWFRRAALDALAKPSVQALFEPEEGQLDGTIAHAMERFFPVEVRRQGYLSMSVKALAKSRPDMPRARLLRLARQHADLPSRYFPAPYEAALPLGVVPPAQQAVALRASLTAIPRAVLPSRVRHKMRRLLRR